MAARKESRKELEIAIAGMKRAIAQYQDSSDTDEPYLQPSNRGNKLKRKSNHLEDGNTVRPSELRYQKKSIEHGGYQRNILRRNPKRYDDYGHELASSSVDEEADARAAEENPYADIRLEGLLQPLVSAASLPEHPSLSVAYTSSVLTNMAQHAREMAHRERKTLANAKRLMIKLRGDETWIPCELLYSERDEMMFNTDKLYKDVISCKPPNRANGYNPHTFLNHEVQLESESDSRKSSSTMDEAVSPNTSTQSKGKDSTDEKRLPLGEGLDDDGNRVEDAMDEGQEGATLTHPREGSDISMKDGQSEMASGNPAIVEKPIEEGILEKGTGLKHGSTDKHEQDDVVREDSKVYSVEDGAVKDTHSPDTAQEESGTKMESEATLRSEDPPKAYLPSPDADELANPEIEDGTEGQVNPQAAPRRMRTRAQAQAASEPTMSSRNVSPDSFEPPEIHPLFKIPESAIPNRNLGLPVKEADELRRLLTMYVQKQEEVTRGAEKLYDRLLRAERERKSVLKWCKAEGHVGEMSDGEDWYDKEEWGLEHDLKKGQNEEDEETNAIQGKKTRGRRA